MLGRAREHVHAGRPRFPATAADGARLAEAFLHASSSGDVAGLAQLLAADAVLYTDGGGKRNATLKPVHGVDRIVRFVLGVQRHPRYLVPSAIVPCRVNKLPGFLVQYDDGDVAVGALEVDAGVIRSIYLINNPDKLRHLRA